MWNAIAVGLQDVVQAQVPRDSLSQGRFLKVVFYLVCLILYYCADEMCFVIWPRDPNPVHYAV